MSTAGLAVLDNTVQKTNAWINDLAVELGCEDKHRVFQGLRTTLYALRDRLTVEEAAHLGAQLPILLSGFYYENWKPARSPSKERHKEEFLAPIRSYLQSIDPNVDVEPLVRAVFKLLTQRVEAGEIEDVVHMMPSELKDLWPESVQA